jgi:phosphoenolpyruvate-protein phosphotransferase (PTS system enzyme I)
MKGIGVSPGIAIGRAWVLRSKKERASGILLADAAAIEREISVYRIAVERAVASLEEMMEQAGDAAEILGVQLELLYDPVWESEVIDRIKRRSTARDAVLDAMEKVMRVFFEMEDVYMRGRAADIQDMGGRLIRMLDGKALVTEMGEGEWIVVSDDLTPSDTIGLDTRALGFVTQVGGATSHAAIVARLRGIPSVTGVSGLLDGVADGAMLAVDGSTGVVLVNPTEEELTVYLEKQEAFIERMKLLAELKDKEAMTLDGVRIELFANIGSADDLEAALEQGAEGVGLLRTELLFLDRDTLPTEEEQFQFYKNVLLRSGGRPVTIRTLDIGGDKPLPYLGLPAEANPFLGYRAIRISLDQPALFLAQLRAILRASVFGNCRIMFPMIGSVEELRKAKAFVTVAQEDLRADGVAFDASVPVGIMIEIPSAALTADLLAKEADFFSIGTNDLCMYVLAVDRLNQKIAALYDPFHPAVLRLIREIIEQGHGHGIPVGMCGEMAGDPQATELLLEMGLREFSMSAGSIPLVKEVVLRSSGLTVSGDVKVV